MLIGVKKRQPGSSGTVLVRFASCLELLAAVRSLAKERGTSVNQIILDSLRTTCYGEDKPGVCDSSEG